MSTHEEDRLRQALHAQASRAGTGQVDLESVTSKARGIRRRRTTLAGVSTAALIALAVPLGLTLTGSPGDDGAPPVAGPSPSASASGGPTAGGVVEVDLLDGAEPVGEPAELPTVVDGEIVNPDGTRLAVPGEGSPVALAVLSDRWIVVKALGEGLHTVDTLSASGDLVSSVPAQPDVAMSDDGTVAAYVARNGDVRTVTTDDGDTVLAPAAEADGATEVAAVIGSTSCAQGDGCTVLLNDGMGGVRHVGPQPAPALDDFVSVGDATATRVLGTVSVADDTSSCSALHDASGQVWRSCDNSFGPMSSDGRYAVGYPSQTDGLGPKSVSIVDLRDGRELVRFADDSRTDTHVHTEVVWESDTSLLVSVWDGEDRSWTLLRATVDGSLEVVASGLPGDDVEPGFRLPVR